MGTNGYETHSYTYGDSDWGDLLTAYDGYAISYDAIGNPTTWYDMSTFTWEQGRRLASAENIYTGLSSSYTYDVDGLRLSKTVGDVEHKYVWQGGKLVSEYFGGKELEFFYDESGSPYAFSYKTSANAIPSYYYYVTNLQGDVVSILDANGNEKASYSYNAWGKILSATGDMASVNPLRYRGYYYDDETGFYYVSSRYYDPAICRWINTDGELSEVGGDILGYNLFAYCFNNPVNMDDSSGEWPKWLSGTLNAFGGALQVAAGVTLGAAVGWTGFGAVAAGFLITNGAATLVQGVGQIVNHVTKSNVLREDNIVRTDVQQVGRAIGGDTGAKIAGGAYDVAVVATSLYAGKIGLEKSMPRIIESKVFSANNGYGFKVGRNIEMFYRNPNAAGGPGGTIFSYKGPLGKFRIDWDPAHGFHSHPPGH